MFRPGQHYDVRLTAPDGYQAHRSYSVASAPESGPEIDITIELLPDGEVSPFFHEVVEAGDRIDVRGPVGGPFTWTADDGGPLLLLAGGSGIVPLMSMLRHRTIAAPRIRVVLVYSARAENRLIYREELERIGSTDDLATVEFALTRVVPPGWSGYPRRIDREMVAQALGDNPSSGPAYICGSNAFVEAAAAASMSCGVKAKDIRTERFGPT
jgi:ferredoxin-NADP reductase